MSTYGNKTVGVTAYLRDSGSPEFMPDLMTVTQPNLELLTDTISGAGINGEIDMPTYAQTASMTWEATFRRMNSAVAKLASPGQHEVETRWVTDVIDSATGAARVVGAKRITKGFTKTLEGGSLEPNAAQEANCSLEVVYDKLIVDGETVWEIDKLNNGFTVLGTNYAQSIQDNL